MEPQSPNTPNQNDQRDDAHRELPPVERPTYEDLHAEGIDIVAGSGISESNEFTRAEADKAAEDTLAEMQEFEKNRDAEIPKDIEAPEPSPLSAEQAAKISSLQEIPAGMSRREPLVPKPIPDFAKPPRPPQSKETMVFQKVPEVPKEAMPAFAKEPVPPKPPQAKERPSFEAPAEKSAPQNGAFGGAFPRSEGFGEPQRKEAPPEIKNDPSIKPLRTFKSDAEEAVKYQNVSAIDIAVAEQKKREGTPIEYASGSHSHAGIILVSLFIIILALVGGWYYWFTMSARPADKPVQTLQIRSIVKYDFASAVVLDDPTDPLASIASRLKSSNVSLGSIYALVPKESDSATAPLSVERLLSATKIPNRLLRSLGADYMVGTYRIDRNAPFLLLTDTFFQNAYSGMLDWEASLLDDMLPLIQVAHPAEDAQALSNLKFSDYVLSNTDVRVARDASGEIVFGYAFPDKNTIVMSTDEKSLKNLISKLLTVQTIQ